MENIFATTDATFHRDVLHAKLPVLVDFWAVWCGPCRTVNSTLVEIAAQFSGRLLIAKLDVDANPRMTENCGVRGVPTLILYKDGQVLETISRDHSRTHIVGVLNKHLEVAGPKS